MLVTGQYWHRHWSTCLSAVRSAIVCRLHHLHLSLGLQPEAKYFTRSSFVSFSVATAGAVAERAIAVVGLNFDGLTTSGGL